jgi:hypothetical protein
MLLVRVLWSFVITVWRNLYNALEISAKNCHNQITKYVSSAYIKEHIWILSVTTRPAVVGSCVMSPPIGKSPWQTVEISPMLTFFILTSTLHASWCPCRPLFLNLRSFVIMTDVSNATNMQKRTELLDVGYCTDIRTRAAHWNFERNICHL